MSISVLASLCLVCAIIIIALGVSVGDPADSGSYVAAAVLAVSGAGMLRGFRWSRPLCLGWIVWLVFVRATGAAMPAPTPGLTAIFVLATLATLLSPSAGRFFRHARTAHPAGALSRDLVEVVAVSFCALAILVVVAGTANVAEWIVGANWFVAGVVATSCLTASVVAVAVAVRLWGSESWRPLLALVLVGSGLILATFPFTDATRNEIHMASTIPLIAAGLVVWLPVLR
jgi:hypothetical protein